jgi:hypothetical protein
MTEQLYVEPAVAIPNTVKPEPTRWKPRSDIDEPTSIKDRVESFSPKRAKLLKLQLDASVVASKIDRAPIRVFVLSIAWMLH